jgi:MinD superfamily P-loop ATPase
MQGISGTGSITFNLVVDDDLCRRCGRCLAAQVCRGNAFRVFDPGETAFIDMSRCWGCLACQVACPFEAVVRTDYGASH